MPLLQHEADLLLLLVLGVSSIFCTEFVLRQNFPATTEICLERRSGTILLKESYSPLPLNLVLQPAKLMKPVCPDQFQLKFNLLSSKQMCFRTYFLDFP